MQTWKDRKPASRKPPSEAAAGGARVTTGQSGAPTRHVCDPTGFNCNCARRAAVNAAAANKGRWLPRPP